jgi:transposase-like protein
VTEDFLDFTTGDDPRAREAIDRRLRIASREGHVVRVLIDIVIPCPKCGGFAVKFGKKNGKQRRQCKVCHHVFVGG